jgi:hypothetical protein
MSEYFPMFDVESAMVFPIFDGEPVAENSFRQQTIRLAWV